MVICMPARTVEEIQKELVESGLIEPISIGGVEGYLSKTGDSKGLVSLDGKPFGVLCGDSLYCLDPQTQSGRYEAPK